SPDLKPLLATPASEAFFGYLLDRPEAVKIRDVLHRDVVAVFEAVESPFTLALRAGCRLGIRSLGFGRGSGLGWSGRRRRRGLGRSRLLGPGGSRGISGLPGIGRFGPARHAW